MYEQQGFEPPPGLSRTAPRNPIALDTLLNHHLAQQETKSGALPATELIAAADELTEMAPNVSKVDLLRHSHAVHQEDYLAAVDSLYKYFDYSTGERLSCVWSPEPVLLPFTPTSSSSLLWPPASSHCSFSSSPAACRADIPLCSNRDHVAMVQTTTNRLAALAG